MTNKMMSSLKFGRQGKINGRHLRPPALQGFDLLSSQGVEQNFDDKIEELSDVEEKSFFESEPEEPDHHDMQIFLGKMERLSKEEEQEISPSRSINRSQRLQDQPIIVVEEENQKSDHFGQHSIILEHLDFNNEEHAPDTTPDWQHQEEKKQEQYLIKVNNQPAWLYSQNGSSSTPREFEYEDKINLVRHSQNTCVDQKRVYENTSRVVNKSCIARPMGGQQLLDVNFKETNIQGKKSRDISDILDKWKEQVYPQDQDGYLDLPFNMERDARVCRSSYQQESPDVEVQTDILGIHIQQERYKFKEQIETLNNKLQNIQQENAKLKEKLNQKRQEFDYLKNSWNQSRTINQTNKKWYEQSQRLENQKKELEKKLIQQTQVLKDYESKAQVLQKKLNQTVSCRPTTDSFPTTIYGKNYFRSMDLKSQHVFGENIHEKCLKQIEELQQYIFDFEQKVAGIDIEVQRRVQMIVEHIERQAQKRGSLELNNMVAKLKDQLKRALTQLQMSESQNRAYELRQNSLKDREAQISRIYQELVQQWRQLEFQKEKNRSPKRQFTSVSQLHGNNSYSPRAMTDRSQKYNYFSTNDLGSLTNRRQKTNFPSYEPNISYDKQPSFLKANKPSWKRDQSSISTFADSGELLAINSKIQKLRKEINRELQSIN